ncbi:MAG: Membrane protein involved in the export of O-antigen and teichoic acid [Frankiales bacterium]|nr:Membrane protein involved in the export of O-antigen and teichoic acid [Frankiales bacterium]
MSRSGVRQLTGRATWNVLDQVVSSGTNLLLSLLVARSLSADGFGAFAVAFTVYAFLVGAGRALIAQPLVVRYASQGTAAFHDASRSATGAAAALGAVAGGVTLASGFLLGGPTGACLVAIGVLLPGLLLQDMWRAVFVSEGRPAAALVNDVAWGVAQFALVGCFLLLDQRSAVAMLVGWGGAALVAAVLGGFQFRGHPQVRSSVSWMRQQRDLVGYYAASFLAVMGANQLTMLLIAGLGEPSDVGALRAAQVVLGPLNLLGYSISAFALPEISRRQLGGAAALKAAVAISALMVLADVAWGLTLLYLPDSVGESLLGDSWSNAQEVLPATLLGVVAVGTGLGATTLMVARGFAKETFLISLVLAPGFLVLGLTGLQLGDAAGAALGLSLAQCVVTPLVWWRVLVLMRRESRASSHGPADGSDGRSTPGLAGAPARP